MSLFPSSRWRLSVDRANARQQQIRKRLGYDKPLTEQQIRTYTRPRARRFWFSGTLALLAVSYFFRAPILVLCALMVLSLGIIPEIWLRISLIGVNFHRSFSEHRLRIGEEVLLSYRLENRKFLPVPWLEVDDELPTALQMEQVKVFRSHKPDRAIFLTSLALWRYQRITRRYRVRALARGIWVLGPSYLRAGDPFGFLQNEAQIEQLDGQNSVLVYPITVPLTRFGLPSRFPFGDERTQRRLIEDPSQIIGIRDYAPGDPMRRVHWKATAKIGTLQSKVYPPTINYNLTIFLNINTAATVSDGIDPPLFELGIAAAASVASWATEHHYSVGLFSNGLPGAGDATMVTSVEAAQAFMRVPPSGNPNQLVRILESLARLQPYFGAQIDNVVIREETRLPVGATLIYISAAAAIKPSMIQRLERLKRRGHAVVILLTGDTPVATGTLLTYRLGGEEEWNAIAQYAITQREPDADADADPQWQRPGQRGAGDDGGDGADHGATGGRRNQPTFRLG